MSSNLILREAAGEIATNYTRKYAVTRGWGEFEVIREIVQNALDETGTVSIEKTPKGLLITDKGKGFNALNLLMRTTTKSKCSRGRFGEGLKISILAAMNLGLGVDIVTDSMHIVPVWKILEIEEPGTGQTVKAEIMVFKYSKIEPVNGTQVLLIGYNGDTYLDRFNLEYNKKIVFKRNTNTCEDKDYPSYMIDEPVKRIYVRNIYVQEIGVKINQKTQTAVNKALFSYDLFDVALSSDRNIPSNWDILTSIGRLWSYVSDINMIESFFKNVIAEGYEKDVKLESYTMREQKVDSSWRNAFRKVFGNAFLKTNEDTTRLAEYNSHFLRKGVQLPDDIRSTLEAIGIQTDDDVLMQITSELPKSPMHMAPEQSDNLEYIKMIHYKIKEKYYPNIGKVFIGTVETMHDATGKAIDNNIYLREDVIRTMITALDVFGHELTHLAFPQLSDNTSDFYSKIGVVMAIITKVIVQDLQKANIPPKVVWES